MSNLIQVPTRNQVDEKSQTIFDNLKKQLGTVPNLYATIGYSSTTLENFLGFSGRDGTGSFNKKELEAIKLPVSEVNACEYCLAAHTTLGKMSGRSEEETIAIRSGSIANEKIKTITDLTRSIAINRGRPEQRLVDAFFAAGFGQADLINLIGLVAAKTFANYLNNVVDTPVDFPEAQPLPTATAV